MSKDTTRTRIEFSATEVDVIDDALRSFTDEVEDEVTSASDEPWRIVEALDRRKALYNALNKMSKARNRTQKGEGNE